MPTQINYFACVTKQIQWGVPCPMIMVCHYIHTGMPYRPYTTDFNSTTMAIYIRTRSCYGLR